MIKFCIDARFLTTVDVGQYFMTKDWRILTIYRVNGLSCVNRTPWHVTFSRVSQHTFQCRTLHWLKVSCAHVIHVSSAWCCWLDTLRISTLHSSPSLSSSFSFSWSVSSSSMWVGLERNPMRASANEELGTLVGNNPLTSYEPNFFDDDQISETTEKFIQESFSDSRPSNLHGLEIDDYTIGRALSSPLFTQEREDPASRRQVYHSSDESLLSSQTLSVGHVRTRRHVDEFGSLIFNVRENPRRDWKNKQLKFLLDRHKERTLADCRAKIQKHEFQADCDWRIIQLLNEIIQSQRGEIDRALARDEQLRRNQQLLREQWLEQNRELREVHEKSLNEMTELKRFQGSTFDTISKRLNNRRSRHYPWIHKQDSRITEWNSLHDWFERFTRCWISTQWKIPRSQSTCVMPTFSRSWRNAKR